MVFRPRPLVFLSVILILVAASLPLQVVLLYEHDWSEWALVFHKLTMLNWLVIVGCLFCAALAKRGSAKLRYALPSLSLLVLVNNLFVGYYGVDFSLGVTLAATLSFGSLNFFMILPSVRQVFAHQKARGWLRADRRRMHVPVWLEVYDVGPVHGRMISAGTFDMSLSGTFVRLPLDELQIGETLLMRLDFGEAQPSLLVRGKVVRESAPRGAYPMGYGIEFIDLSWRERLALRRQLENPTIPMA